VDSQQASSLQQRVLALTQELEDLRAVTESEKAKSTQVHFSLLFYL
jgi:hypothetical protein